MIEIVYRYDSRNPAARRLTATLAEAVAALVQGNRRLSDLVEDDERGGGEAPHVAQFEVDLGLSPERGAPTQRPFGIVLGCADARVPVEMVFGQAVNDLFVVRVAGNVIGSECLGSIDYAVHHFTDSVRVVAVLGHSGCGAVSAAVDAFLRPALYLDLATSFPLRTIIDRLLVAVRAASKALEELFGRDVTERPGYRDALVELAVVVNAAYSAYSIRAELGPVLRQQMRVVYGIYDLATRRVRPGLADSLGLAEPPEGVDGFRQQILVEGSTALERLLGPAATA